ncbi:MAG: DUF393 domain-containing protein [Saprospiraceae bacterium]|nr:DUF393 domain-containing protein [Saprospiraceae bacterium]
MENISEVSKISDRPVLFFDGVCNLCNASIQFILKHERNTDLLFSALQSPLGSQIRDQIPPDTDSLVLYEKGNTYICSTAALRIAGYLRFPYHWLKGLLLIPLFIRDPVYKFIARHRYWFFGKKDSCMIPAPQYQKRFI